MIDRQLHQRAKEIVADALLLASAERSTFVSNACASDLRLLDEVQSLLCFSNGDEQGFNDLSHDGRHRLEGLLTPSRTTDRSHNYARHASTDLPKAVGKYRIARLVGEGGMGRVYEALQDRPRRRVALKLIRSVHNSDVLLRRFEYEAQTLGRLEHPGIARIYEAGSDEVILSESPRIVAGPAQPFIAMEFVDGEPLDCYVERLSLSIPDRLRLFANVCQAVNHAHTHGVIHRDLKPNNILVTADGTPKILDFGIARAVEEGGAGLTMTHVGQPVGTPAYMSPEQAEGSRDIDTRTDVYSLGIILYELLTGMTPFHQEQKAASIFEMQRLIRDVTPPKPSTAIRLNGQPAANPNSADLQRARSMIRSELDWIVMKAIEKDRTRRYPSAAEFAEDIHRHLSGEAVQARPASALYLLRVFARRHAGATAAIASVFVILLSATIISTAMYRTSEANRRRAVEAEQTADIARREEQSAKESAIASGRVTRLVSEFQARMLAEVDPTGSGTKLFQDIENRYAAATKAHGLSLEEQVARLESFRALLQEVNATDTAAAMIDATVLAPAVQAIDAEFADQPEVDAALRQTLARLYRSLGLFDAALPLQEKALNTRQKLLGNDHPETLESMLDMGLLLRHRGDYAAARKIIEEGLELISRRTGSESPETLRWTSALGAVLCLEGKLDDAEPYLRATLQKRLELLGDDHPETLGSMNDLGTLLRNQGKLSEAEPYFRRCLDRSEDKFSEKRGFYLNAMNNLASVLQGMGRMREAESLWQETLKLTRRAYGNAHPETLTVMNNLGVTLIESGKIADAKILMAELLETTRRSLGAMHPQTLALTGNIGLLFQEAGDWEQAEKYYRAAYELKSQAIGADHPETLISLYNFGTLQLAQGRFDDAESSFKTAMEGLRAVRGADHPSTISARAYYGWALRLHGQPAEAEPHLRDSLERRRRVLGPDHFETMNSIDNLAFALRDLKRLDESESLFREAVQTARRLSNNNPAAPAGYLLELGRILNAQAKYAQAESALRECLQLRAQAGATNDWRNAYIHGILGESLAGLDKFSEAESLLLDAWDHVKDDPAIPPRTVSHDVRGETVQRIIGLYERWHAAEPSGGHAEQAAEWRMILTRPIGMNVHRDFASFPAF